MEKEKISDPDHMCSVIHAYDRMRGPDLDHPAGAYETEKVGNPNKVIAGTYHVIDSTPVGPWGVLMAVMAGFYKSAKLIFMIMFCGGAVAVLEKVDPSTRPLDGWLPIRSSTPMSWLF